MFTRPRLTSKPDGTFKIVQFTDLHFGESWRKDGATQLVGTIHPFQISQISHISFELLSLSDFTHTS